MAYLAPQSTNPPRSTRSPLSTTDINPSTWLATDYLNHFAEPIMLLELCAEDPDCLKDFLAWKPKTYREHFAGSCLKSSQVALAAYDAADPVARGELNKLSDMMVSVLQATSAAMRSGLKPADANALAQSVVSGLRPLVARAGAVINGEAEAASPPQVIADAMMATAP